MLKFEMLKMMASAFTPDFSIGNNLLLINTFQELSGKKFDGEFFSGQIPQEAPAEIPRIILNSLDNCWKLEISLQRTNLVLLKPLASPVKAPSLKEFGSFAKEIFARYKSQTDIRIQRLALVTERFFKIEETPPSQFLATKFCNDIYLEKDKPFDRPNGFEIHSLKKYEREGFKVNSWVRLKSGNLLDSTRTPILIAVNDINTLSIDEEPSTDFNDEDIIRFYEFFPDHVESIIDIYFN